MSTSSASIAGSDISTSTTPTSPTTTMCSEDQQSPAEALPWIIHHILNPECPPELPLSIMFAFNSDRFPDSVKESLEWWNLDPKGRLLQSVLSSLADEGQSSKKQEQKRDLELDLNNISGSSTHPLDQAKAPEYKEKQKQVRFVGLPEDLPKVMEKLTMPEEEEEGEVKNKPKKKKVITFYTIETVCRRAFPAEYERADFRNSLQALDYLRVLEHNRRVELQEIGLKWGLNKYNWTMVFRNNEAAYNWWLKMQRLETEIQKWYAELYIGLRIWIMINELKNVWTSTRTSRQDILAVLNTLYPPVLEWVPNDQISIPQLTWHRKIIFGWILAVEKEGPEAMIAIEEEVLKGKHSWRKVTLCLENYLKYADNHMAFSTSIPTGKIPEGGNAPLAPTFLPRIPSNLETKLVPLAESEEEEDTAYLYPRPLFSLPEPRARSPTAPLPSNRSNFLNEDPLPTPPPLPELRKQSSWQSLYQRLRATSLPNSRPETSGSGIEKHDSKFPPESLNMKLSLEILDSEFAKMSPVSGKNSDLLTLNTKRSLRDLVTRKNRGVSHGQAQLPKSPPATEFVPETWKKDSDLLATNAESPNMSPISEKERNIGIPTLKMEKSFRDLVTRKGRKAGQGQGQPTSPLATEFRFEDFNTNSSPAISEIESANMSPGSGKDASKTLQALKTQKSFRNLLTRKGRAASNIQSPQVTSLLSTEFRLDEDEKKPIKSNEYGKEDFISYFDPPSPFLRTKKSFRNGFGLLKNKNKDKDEEKENEFEIVETGMDDIELDEYIKQANKLKKKGTFEVVNRGELLPDF